MNRPKRLRPYLPNRSDRLALVSTRDSNPFSAYWPLIITQLVGGKTWSISYIRHTTPRPIPTELLRESQRQDAAKEGA